MNVISMNKVISVMLILFFISGLFVTMFSSVSSSELVESSWNVKAPMQQERLYFGVVVVDDKIYAIGGVSDRTGTVGANERYDSMTDTWVTLTSIPTPRAGFAIVEYQNKIYCIGGYAGRVILDVNEVYDIATDSWSTKTSLPVNESYIQAHVVDGKIYVVTQQVLYVYDPVEDSWTSKTSTPTQRIHGYSAVVDNKIIIIDQIAQPDVYPDYSNVRVVATMKVMIYDPKTDVWSEGQTSPEYDNWDHSMMISIVAGTTTGFYAPKRIYFIFATTSIHIYDLVEETWSTAWGPERTEFTGCGVGVVDDVLYMIGVSYSSSHVSSYRNAWVMQYVPSGHKDAVPAPEPSNSTTSPVITEPTSPAVTTSEHVDIPELNLTYIIVAVLAVTIITFAMGLFFYFKSGNSKTSDKRIS
jgi:hypothetical protein